MLVSLFVLVSFDKCRKWLEFEESRKPLIPGQKTILLFSLVEGHNFGNLFSLQAWGQLFVYSCKPVQTNTKMLSDNVLFLSFVVLDKDRGGGGRGSLPELTTLVKGNYILIPFRNLVYIWLPGTSANCLQCLSLCLLGACVRRLCEHATHTYTHRQDCQRLCLAHNTTHAGVITMQVDYSNYCVISCLSIWIFFFFSNTACWTGLTLLAFRLVSRLQPHPLTPLYLYEGPKNVFKV